MSRKREYGSYAELYLSKEVVVEVSRLTERALNSSESRHNPSRHDCKADWFNFLSYSMKREGLRKADTL